MKIIKEKKLIIVGDSAFAQIAYEYFQYDSSYEVIAFTVEKAFLKNNVLLGLPVLELENLESIYSPADYEVFVALTYHAFNRTRTRLYHTVKEKGYKVASYISSKAFVWRNVEYGENCFIFEDNTIQPFVKLGNNVILWSGNHIGHHSVIMDNCFISSHVVISGFCEIGENTFIGVNAAIANNLKIAKNNFIGMGAVIISDTEEEKIYVGNPAKPLKGSALDMGFFK